MKKSNLLLNLLMAMTMIFAFNSCKEDPVVEEKEGLPVADGFYITKVDVDPVATQQLKVAMVDAPDFGAQSREGFYQNYVYLTAGSYNIVEVTEKAIGSTLGGSITSITEVPSADNEECETTEYSLINATEGGAAFSVPSDGLYVVAYDETMSEIVFDEIVSAAIIGDGTPGGWGDDTPMTGTISAEGASWSIEDVTLKVGVFKFRFNCRWAIDRRIDPLMAFDNANGYSFFTNYGGTIDNLSAGNEVGNIPIAERANYTVTFTWDPIEGVSGTLTRTGDAPELTFDPDEWKWGIIGSVTASGFDKDYDMQYNGESDGTYTWTTVVTFADEASDAGTGGLRRYKFRINDSWDTNLGGTLTTTDSDLSFGSADITPPAAGDYYITLATSDDGVSWTATMSEDGWGAVGDGSPAMAWPSDGNNPDVALTPAIVDGKETYTITGDFTTDGWKFRAGKDWALNVGTDGAVGGDNIVLSEAGNYTIVLSYDGVAYSVVSTKN